MSLILDDWYHTKKLVDKLARETADRKAEARVALKAVQKAFKCKTLSRAKRLQKQDVQKEITLCRIWNKKYKRFNTKWRKRLNSQT